LNELSEPLAVVERNGEMGVDVDETGDEGDPGQGSDVIVMARCDFNDFLTIHNNKVLVEHLTGDRVKDAVGEEGLTCH
jgi:hypothetical protein